MSENTNATPQPTIKELSERIDQLEHELEWTRSMVDYIKEQIDDMNSSNNNLYE